jgi:WD40 repeat protein
VPISLGGHAKGVTRVSLSPDERWLVTAAFDGSVRLWSMDAVTGGKLDDALPLRTHAQGRISLAWTEDGRFFLTGSADGVVRLFDTDASDQEGEEVDRVVDTPVTSVGVGGPDGLVLVGCENGDIRVVDLGRGANEARLVHTVHAHVNAVNAVAWNKEFPLFASGGDDKRAFIWSSYTQTKICELQGHSGRAVNCVQWSADNKHLLTACSGGVVRIFDAESGELVRSVSDSRAGSVRWAEWHPRLALVASAHEDGALRMWDTLSGALRRTFEPHSGPMLTLSWSDHFIATGALGDKAVRVWSVKDLPTPDPSLPTRRQSFATALLAAATASATATSTATATAAPDDAAASGPRKRQGVVRPRPDPRAGGGGVGESSGAAAFSLSMLRFGASASSASLDSALRELAAERTAREDAERKVKSLLQENRRLQTSLRAAVQRLLSVDAGVGDDPEWTATAVRIALSAPSPPTLPPPDSVRALRLVDAPKTTLLCSGEADASTAVLVAASPDAEVRTLWHLKLAPTGTPGAGLLRSEWRAATSLRPHRCVQRIFWHTARTELDPALVRSLPIDPCAEENPLSHEVTYPPFVASLVEHSTGSMAALRGASRALSNPELIRFARDAALALAHLRNCGLLHLALRPAAFLQREDGSWMLADLGNAKHVREMPTTRRPSRAPEAAGAAAATSDVGGERDPLDACEPANPTLSLPALTVAHLCRSNLGSIAPEVLNALHAAEATGDSTACAPFGGQAVFQWAVVVGDVLLRAPPLGRYPLAYSDVDDEHPAAYYTDDAIRIPTAAAGVPAPLLALLRASLAFNPAARPSLREVLITLERLNHTERTASRGHETASN